VLAGKVKQLLLFSAKLPLDNSCISIVWRVPAIKGFSPAFDSQKDAAGT